MDLKKYEEDIAKATTQCEQMSFQEKVEGLWDNDEIIEYFTQIPVDEPTNYLANSICQLVKDDSESKILVVGGGTGRLGREIDNKSNKIKVCEVDLSQKMVKTANKIAKRNGLEKRFNSYVGDGCNLYFSDKYFNFAVCYGMVRYLPISCRLALNEEMYRVCKEEHIIAEGFAKECIQELATKIDKKFTKFEESMTFFRTSLFFMLYRRYQSNMEFKKNVNHDAEADNKSFIKILSQIAGTKPGKMYGIKVFK